MEWHVNDLSLDGQFATAQDLRAALGPILAARVRRPDLRRRMFCSRTFCTRPATPSETLQRAIIATRDSNYIRLALEWFANAGPFWDDNRADNPDDLFFHDVDDVTDQGLGEAARRTLNAVDAGTFSFLDQARRFARSPLSVVHGLLEEPLGRVELENVWTVEDLEARTAAQPTTWAEMIESAATTMDMLVFATDIEGQLRPTPFHRGACERILVLLRVLQTIAVETRDDSSLTERGVETLQRHFVGEKAWFTDESDTNKRKFREELTFPDPAGGLARLFCPWHGKVKIGQFRIHFEWLRPHGQRRIKIVYIGPKITRA